MEGVYMIAVVFGPLLAIIGLWMLLYGDNLVKVLTSMKTTPAIFYLNGVINLLIGLVIVNTYNVWAWNGWLLITLLGWAMIIRGILILFIPQLVIKTTMHNPTTIKVMGIIPLIWGLAICWATAVM